jgi:hypothetical protein
MTKSTSKATFEVHCQGKFTSIPEGILFIGAEITKKMNLGLITRGICRSVLQFVNSVNPFIHSSFGDGKEELPHIVGPLWTLADKVVKTPPTETPPKLGNILQEDNDSRARRRGRNLYEEKIDLDSTYSFSVNTNNIELCDWNMVNIPLLKAMDLHTFWDDADLRLCCYSVPQVNVGSTTKPGVTEIELAKCLPKVHHQSTNRYLMCLLLEHLSNHPERTSTNDTESAIDKENLFFNNFDNTVVENVNRESVDSDDFFYDAVDNESFFEEDDKISRKISATSLLSPSIDAIERSVSDSGSWIDSFNFVPAATFVSDIVRSRSVLGVGTGRRELYLFCAPASFFSSSSTSPYRTTLQSYKEFAKCFEVEDVDNSHAYSRMSRTEKRRQELQHVVTQYFRAATWDESLRKVLTQFFDISTHTDYFLLEDKIHLKNVNNGVGNPRLRADLRSEILLEGFVCTRVGQSHWSEEYLCATRKKLVFIQHSIGLTEKKRRCILWEDIISIKVADSKLPLDDCHGFLIVTFFKEYSIVVRGSSVLDRWMEVLLELHNSTPNSSELTIHLTNSSKQFDLFYQSADWNLGSRVLLNGRKQFGKSIIDRKQDVISVIVESSHLISCDTEPLKPVEKNSFDNNDACGCNDLTEKVIAPKHLPDIDMYSRNFPLLIVGKAMRLISMIATLSLVTGNVLDSDDSIASHWMSFLDLVSVLPSIDLSQYTLTTEELLCLYLNLYHTMLLHAGLIAGVPSTFGKWPSFFNNLSYEAFGDIFSLAELEHAIVKGEFTTDGIVTQLVIRQSKYDFVVPEKDFCLLFAMNCGSLSLPRSVPMFIPSKLDEQLDDCVRSCLNKQLRVTQGRGNIFVIELPMVFQLYESDLKDICSKMDFSSQHKKSINVLRLLINFCGTKEKDIFSELMTNKRASFSLKYCKLDFRCRILNFNFPIEDNYDFSA